MSKYENTYRFLQKNKMRRDTFVDMITAICISNRDNFHGYEGDALDGKGKLNQEYFEGVSYVIACMVAQRFDASVDTFEPADALRLDSIEEITWEEQRAMVDRFVKAYE